MQHAKNDSLIPGRDSPPVQRMLALARCPPIANLRHVFNTYRYIVALALTRLICSMAVEQAGPTHGIAATNGLINGPVYLQHMHARVLCMSECERLLYLNNGRFPGFLIKIHVFSNHSSAAQLNNDPAAEYCTAHFSIRRNGIILGGAELELPPLYHILQGDFDNPFHEPFSDIPFNIHLQTLVALVEVEISSWTCAGHSAKVVPPTPIRIGSRSVVMQWAETLQEESTGLAQETVAPSHNLENCEYSVMHTAVMVSWMMSLKRRPERWEWGRASAAHAGLDVARWLVVDGRREDARSCIDIETAFARGLGVSSIQPYTALAAALSHKLLHKAIAQHGPYAGLCASPQSLGGHEHGPGGNSSLSCDALLAPLNLSRSMDSGVDWVVVVEDDLLPNVTAADLHKVVQAIPLNFDLVWLGHCPCIWNGPGALPGQHAPVVSVSISHGRVVQLWRGAASCLHAYAVNPSSTHITSTFINLFDGVQWKPACEREYLRCLVAVVVPLEAADLVRSINGLPGMFDQNKELVSEIHNAPL